MASSTVAGLRQDTRDAVLHEQAVLGVPAPRSIHYGIRSIRPALAALLRTGCLNRVQVPDSPSGSTILYCCSYSVFVAEYLGELCEHALRRSCGVNQLAGLFGLSAARSGGGDPVQTERNASSSKFLHLSEDVIVGRQLPVCESRLRFGEIRFTLPQCLFLRPCASVKNCPHLAADVGKSTSSS